ncbi:MAG: DUF3089 domain-containing protein [Sphingomicrobium sp.]
MCARRFLIIVFLFILLGVAGAFAIFQFGGNVLLKSATPRGHFEAKAAGDGPDYTQSAAWLARPGLDSAASWLPDGFERAAPGKAAAFYVHPTTYLNRDRWNAPLDPGGQTSARTTLFLRSQASALSSAGDIWAPRYRQAAYGAFLLDSPDATRALDLAYSDVLAAFDTFIADVPADRPLILAGHSQGSLHLLRLLADRKTKLSSRLVAAYVVGWPISTTADLPATGLAACATPAATGCVMSWQSFGQPANPNLVLDAWEKAPGRSAAHRRADIICTNPVTGTVGGASLPVDNPGTLVPDGNFTSASLAAGQVGARCDHGLLEIGGAIPALGPYVLPGNNYHVYDYALFWAAIRRDAERRLAAWRR